LEGIVEDPGRGRAEQEDPLARAIVDGVTSEEGAALAPNLDADSRTPNFYSTHFHLGVLELDTDRERSLVIRLAEEGAETCIPNALRQDRRTGAQGRRAKDGESRHAAAQSNAAFDGDLLA